MSGVDLSAPVAELLALLHAADVDATANPGEVETPGVWVAVDEIRPRSLSGAHELVCSAYVIAGDTDAMLALSRLGDELAKVRSVITPDGPVTTTAVVLPSGPTPLPALRVPVHLYTETE